MVQADARRSGPSQKAPRVGDAGAGTRRPNPDDTHQPGGGPGHRRPRRMMCSTHVAARHVDGRSRRARYEWRSLRSAAGLAPTPGTHLISSLWWGRAAVGQQYHVEAGARKLGKPSPTTKVRGYVRGCAAPTLGPTIGPHHIGPRRLASIAVGSSRPARNERACAETKARRRQPSSEKKTEVINLPLGPHARAQPVESLASAPALRARWRMRPCPHGGQGG